MPAPGCDLPPRPPHPRGVPVLCVVHVYACGLHILDALLKLEELKAAQIQLDRETGLRERDRVLTCCRKVRDRSKWLIVHRDRQRIGHRDWIEPGMTLQLDKSGMH